MLHTEVHALDLYYNYQKMKYNEKLQLYMQWQFFNWKIEKKDNKFLQDKLAIEFIQFEKLNNKSSQDY